MKKNILALSLLAACFSAGSCLDAMDSDSESSDRKQKNQTLSKNNQDSSTTGEKLNEPPKKKGSQYSKQQNKRPQNRK